MATYIQSGNVIFTSDVRSPQRLGRALEERLSRDLGLAAGVLVRTEQELADVVARNLFARPPTDVSKLHVTFLSEAPDATRVAALGALSPWPDEFRLIGREGFLHCPNGYGKTKLNNAFFERRLAVRATTRTWKPVTALLRLAGG
ncbi:MAG: DUF1697 domain-containing protein [Actinobacteria bacterium]|nr:DUF1697 domain-containing protein [Actinomycetota bacterium]